MVYSFPLNNFYNKILTNITIVFSRRKLMYFNFINFQESCGTDAVAVRDCLSNKAVELIVDETRQKKTETSSKHFLKKKFTACGTLSVCLLS